MDPPRSPPASDEDSPANDATQQISDALRAFRSGDPSGLETIMTVCSGRMRSTAMRYLTSRADVDDALQEAWIALARKADTIEDPRAVGSWLNITAGRAALAIAKRQRRTVDGDSRTAAALFVTEDEDVVQRCERRDAVRCAVARLARDEQQLAWMLFDENLSYEQVSTRSGRPVGSLGPTRSRILRKLRRDPGIADHAQYTMTQRHVVPA